MQVQSGSNRERKTTIPNGDIFFFKAFVHDVYTVRSRQALSSIKTKFCPKWRPLQPWTDVRVVEEWYPDIFDLSWFRVGYGELFESPIAKPEVQYHLNGRVQWHFVSCNGSLVCLFMVLRRCNSKTTCTESSTYVTNFLQPLPQPRYDTLCDSQFRGYLHLYGNTMWVRLLGKPGFVSKEHTGSLCWCSDNTFSAPG